MPVRTEARDFWKLFKASACSIKLKGETKEEVFDEIIEDFVKAGLLPSELRGTVRTALLERERIASTGVGQAVAIPHVKVAGLERAVVGVSVHLNGLEWNALDGAPVRILFTVLRPAKAGPDHDPERHLEMMRWISHLARKPDFRNFARAARKRTELVELLREMSTS